MRRTRKGSGSRRGMALPTALLVILVLTLLGAAAAMTASIDLDISGNGRQELQALSYAEAGIHEAFARLNMKTGNPPARITPDVLGGGEPDPDWDVTVVDGVPGLDQRQTLSAGGPAAALSTTTRIEYKKEAAEAPTSHCNGACDDEVVRFHTNFDYSGTNVPTGARIGPPVLKITSTYTSPTGASKTILVEAVRSLTQADTDAPLRSCGPVNCGSAASEIDATLSPTNQAIIAGPGGVTGCASNVLPAAATTEAAACPADLFSETFGMSKADMKGIADIVTPAPYGTPPNNTKGKIIYVTGASQSTWQSNPVIGTQEEPVIVIFEGDFRIQGNIEIFGVVYISGTFTIGAGNPEIHGAIISENPANTVNITGNIDFQYDPSVLDNLNRLSPFTTVLWRD
jgi:PilX N-terminal